MNYKRLIISILAPQAAGLVGTFFTAGSVTGWYAMLNKPSFNPPNEIFGPVWTILYLFMGVAIYWVWQESETQDTRLAQKLFWGQLTVNASWSIVFFGFQNLIGALMLLVGMWLLILATILEFWRIKRLSAYLMIPYLLWVTFAGVLNAAIIFLN